MNCFTTLAVGPIRPNSGEILGKVPIGYFGPVTNEENALSEQEELELIRSTPVDVVIGNHIFHLIQLAAVHLASTPPGLEQASLVIDLVSAMVSAAGDRLGEHADLYKNAVAEVQQVYVRAASPASEQ